MGHGWGGLGAGAEGVGKSKSLTVSSIWYCGLVPGGKKQKISHALHTMPASSGGAIATTIIRLRKLYLIAWTGWADWRWGARNSKR